MSYRCPSCLKSLEVRTNGSTSLVFGVTWKWPNEIRKDGTTIYCVHNDSEAIETMRYFCTCCNVYRTRTSMLPCPITDCDWNKQTKTNVGVFT